MYDLKDTICSRLRKELKQLEGTYIDIIYHPQSSYRRVEQRNVKMIQCYSCFFEIEVMTQTYGSYHTTINYMDVYTNSCVLRPHKKDFSNTDRNWKALIYCIRLVIYFVFAFFVFDKHHSRNYNKYHTPQRYICIISCVFTRILLFPPLTCDPLLPIC